MQHFHQSLMVAGAFTLSSPLQFVKSRLQTQSELLRINHSQASKTLFEEIKSISKRQGIKAFWKGNLLGLLRFFPNESINFSFKNQAQSSIGTSIYANISAGICGGFVSSSILYPLDTLRLQIANNLLGKNGLKIPNLFSLYKGFKTSLLSIIIFRGLYVGMFDTLKKFNLSPQQKAVAAYFSSLIASTAVYPLDTLRKKMITLSALKENVDEKEFCKKVVREGKIKSLFAGSKIMAIQSLVGAANLLYFDSKIY